MSPHGGRYRRAVGVDTRPDGRTAGTRLVEQGGQVDERRLRRRGAGHLVATVRRGVAQHPEDVAQIGERGVRLGPHDPGRRDGLVGGEPRAAVLERTGVQRDQGQPVAQDVVHLAGDVGAFLLAGTVLAQLLVAFEQGCALAQGQQQRPALADPDADRDEQGDADGAGDHDLPERHGVALGRQDDVVEHRGTEQHRTGDGELDGPAPGGQ
nr:hypothetical protein N8D75_16690 [Curtobacterium flaccumfaciens]